MLLRNKLQFEGSLLFSLSKKLNLWHWCLIARGACGRGGGCFNSITKAKPASSNSRIILYSLWWIHGLVFTMSFKKCLCVLQGPPHWGCLGHRRKHPEIQISILKSEQEESSKVSAGVARCVQIACDREINEAWSFCWRSRHRASSFSAVPFSRQDTRLHPPHPEWKFSQKCSGFLRSTSNRSCGTWSWTIFLIRMAKIKTKLLSVPWSTSPFKLFSGAFLSSPHRSTLDWWGVKPPELLSGKPANLGQWVGTLHPASPLDQTL